LRPYVGERGARLRPSLQTQPVWSLGYGNGTFGRNHAQAIIACDFCVVTAAFRLLYVFVVMEHATHRVLHTNVTAHPTVPWTLQQLREAMPADHRYYFLLHDHDSIFSQRLDQSLRNLGLRVVKTPPQSPQAHVLCERLMSTLRLSAWLLSCPSQQITCDVCCTQECSITTQGARTCC
jgi:putative transposase